MASIRRFVPGTDSCSAAKAASYSISRQAIGLYAVYPSTRNLSANARVFIDLLIERFGDDPF
jgi:DNA-binding transcriptional LysR family regulator